MRSVCVMCPKDTQSIISHTLMRSETFALTSFERYCWNK